MMEYSKELEFVFVTTLSVARKNESEAAVSFLEFCLLSLVFFWYN